MKKAASRFSWMALVAATTLGSNASAGMLRAQVRADVPLAEGKEYRLVVHSYDAPRDGESVPANAKPVGSTQMAVTASDLVRGVNVDLIEVRSGGESGRAPIVVAWLETGKADLDFDGREARPNDSSIVGRGRADNAQVAVTLKGASSRLADRSSRTRRSKSRAV